MSHSGFLQAICERPHDLDVRLIFADWLEDSDPARAKFIRTQCELTNTPQWKDPANHGGPSHDQYLSFMKFDCHWCNLECREHELLSKNWSLWMPDVGRPKACGNRDAFPRSGLSVGGEHIVMTFRNGFVYSVSCTQADWIANGKEIVQAQPIEDVRLTDKEPYVFNPYDGDPPRWRWYEEEDPSDRDVNSIAESLFELVYPVGLSNYGIFRDEIEAQLALSHACVSWARSQAQLPALEMR